MNRVTRRELKPVEEITNRRTREMVRRIVPNVPAGQELEVVERLFKVTRRIRRFGLPGEDQNSLTSNNHYDLMRLEELMDMELINDFYAPDSDVWNGEGEAP